MPVKQLYYFISDLQPFLSVYLSLKLNNNESNKMMYKSHAVSKKRIEGLHFLIRAYKVINIKITKVLQTFDTKT